MFEVLNIDRYKVLAGHEDVFMNLKQGWPENDLAMYATTAAGDTL